MLGRIIVLALALLVIVGYVLAAMMAYVLVKDLWFWICRFMVWALPKGSWLHRWFESVLMSKM